MDSCTSARDRNDKRGLMTKQQPLGRHPRAMLDVRGDGERNVEENEGKVELKG